jgi:enhancing lycopene biosynthesis protein 2
MKTIGVILSGCGVQDGSEIHEAVATLLALSRRGARAICLAPEGQQTRVMDHLTDTELPEQRNMLVEAARIARGEVHALASIDAETLDGIVIPGGFGAALNLSDFASKGKEMTIHPDVETLLNQMADAGKPLCALCIAPPILAKLMANRGATGAQVTIGNDPATAAAIDALGANHITATATEAVIDETHKLVTGPAYMLAESIAELFEGIDNAVAALLDLA